jgi:hypothetical protein
MRLPKLPQLWLTFFRTGHSTTDFLLILFLVSRLLALLNCGALLSIANRNIPFAALLQLRNRRFRKLRISTALGRQA